MDNKHNIVEYDYIVHSPKYNNENMTKYYLITNGNESIWLNKRQYDKGLENIRPKKFFYKNLASDSVYYHDKLIDRKKVLVKDKLAISKSREGLENMIDFNGNKFTVKVLDEVKINDGPWKFKSNKGLIAFVKSEYGLFSWVLKSIKPYNSQLNLTELKEIIERNKFLSFEDFKIKYVKEAKKLIKEFNSKGEVTTLKDYRPEVLNMQINR